MLKRPSEGYLYALSMEPCRGPGTQLGPAGLQSQACPRPEALQV